MCVCARTSVCEASVVLPVVPAGSTPNTRRLVVNVLVLILSHVTRQRPGHMTRQP